MSIISITDNQIEVQLARVKADNFPNQATRVQTIARLRKNVPSFLQKQAQFIVWKYQTVEGKEKKPPFSPHSGKAASPTNPKTWGTFEQAIARYARGGYAGIGYALNGSEITALDADHCINPQTGEIELWAQTIIDSLKPYAYIETSPSNEGLRFLINAKLPFHGRKEGNFEAYKNLRYITLTGNHLEDTPTNLLASENAQSALDEILQEYFPNDFNVNTVGGHAHISSEPQPIYTRNRSDDQVLEKARNAEKNGWKFENLWNGKHQGQDHSRADLSLCGMLAYWTNSDENQIDRLFRQSGLYREDKWNERHSEEGLTYGQMTINLAIASSKDYSIPKPPRRQERSIPHIPHQPEPERQETSEERHQLLQTASQNIANQVRAHIEREENSVLIELVPPGVGKSHTVAQLGASQYNLAWIAERHGMVRSVKALQSYRHIHACTKENCEHHVIHNELAQRGYNSRSIHNEHQAACDYIKQFQEEGSAVYQLAHVKTCYPSKHDAIVTDEFDITKWLPEQEITIEDLQRALRNYSPESTADRFLRSLQGLITDTTQQGTAIHGKAIFDALDKKAHAHLTNWLGELDHDAKNSQVRPFARLNPDDPNLEENVRHLAPVIMPQLLMAFMAEISKWQRGKEWNSCIRIGPGGNKADYSLHITIPRQFTSDDEGKLPPQVILDATADPEIHGRILGKKINIHREIVPVVPGTQHIAVRTGKRYGKGSLCHEKTNDLERVVKECKYILHKVDPSGEKARAGQIGVISFKGCIDQIADALEIPKTVERDEKVRERRAWFWNLRGSNELEDCEILLIVGTPSLHPDDLNRIARVLYRDDLEPIRETTKEEYKSNGRRHTDPRVQHLAEYMACAELTQAAHRNRPVRHSGKTIISLCTGDIDYLPVTVTITDLPYLTENGQSTIETRHKAEEKRLEKAYAELAKDGKQPTQSELAKTAKVRKANAAEWMRAHPPTVFTQKDQSSQVPIRDILYWETGTSENAPPELSKPPSLSPAASTIASAEEAQPEITPEQIAEKLSAHHVVYHAWKSHSCGCKLWRMSPWGEELCCRCQPGPLWTNQTNRMIAVLYPGNPRSA